MEIILGIIVVVIFYAVITYNSLIGKRNQIENVFGTIDVQLKKRLNLIPDLVETVKAYMSHEKDLLEKITALRGQALNQGQDMTKAVEMDRQISSALGGIMVAVENYPDLKSNEHFSNLQRSMNEIESQIAAARRTFNSTVTSYNDSCEKFPSNLFAGFFGFKRREVFSIPQAERVKPDVKKMFNN